MKQHKWLIVVALTVGLVLGGCSNQQSSQPSTDKVSSAKHSKKSSTSSKKDKSSKKSSSTASSQSSRKTVQKAKTLDLAAIKKGDYTSVTGDWVMVAAQINRMGGQGSEWTTPNQNEKLRVTPDYIATDDIMLRQNQLTASGYQGATGNQRERGGALTIEAETGPHDWVFGFYPAGTKDADTTWPATVDTSKEHLTLWNGDQPYLRVFERRSDTPQQAPKTIDVTGVAAGDYSSMNGTWKNGQGRTITVQNNVMTFSDFGVGRNQAAPGTLTNGVMNIPSMNDANGQPAQVPSVMNTTDAGYKQQLEVRTDFQPGMTVLLGGVPMAAYVIGFMPAGQNATLNNGDASRDRIVAFVTQSSLENIANEELYYRVN